MSISGLNRLTRGIDMFKRSFWKELKGYYLMRDTNGELYYEYPEHPRSEFKELIGMQWYVTDDDIHFYAWNAKKAIAKHPGKCISLITNYGDRIKINCK